MTTELTEHDLDLAQPILDILTQHDPVQQMKILELIVAMHCMRMGNLAQARFVLDSFHKHVRQIMTDNPSALERE